MMAHGVTIQEPVAYVCPDCGAWASETSNLHPNYSSCEQQGHRLALAFAFVLVGEGREIMQGLQARIDADPDPDERPPA